MLKLAEKKAAAATAHLQHSDVTETLHTTPAPQSTPQPNPTVVGALTDCLAGLGVERAFGVSGGAIALLFDALADSSIELNHFRHESGAAFAAAEAYFASGKPTVAFATTGPGLLNALTGITAARWDGAKVILLSGATSSAQRGRWATQETSPYTMPQDVFYTQGPIFDFAVRMEHAAEFPEVIRRLSAGLSRPAALASVTLAGARMLDLDDRLGSISVGKDADLVVLSGDPLSVYAMIEQTWVDGHKVFDLSDPDDRKYAYGGEGASHGMGKAPHCCIEETR